MSTRSNPGFAVIALALGLSSTGVTAIAEARDKAPSQAEARAFIEQTRIAAPKRVGEFVLGKTEYDPETKSSGAFLRYDIPDRPDLHIDLFIYPAGDLPHDDAVKAGMKDFRASLDAAAKAGYYDDLRVLDTTDFEIPPPPAATDEVATPSDASGSTSPPDRNAARDPEIETMLAALAPKPIVGRRMDLRYRMPIGAQGEPVPMYSRGYLFHRQLYYFKGRISAPESQIDRTTFESLTDRAMRTLVPAVVASNIGGCSQVSITLDRKSIDKDASIADLLLQMIGGSDMGIERHCFETREEAMEEEPKDATIVVIDYDPSDWGGTP